MKRFLISALPALSLPPLRRSRKLRRRQRCNVSYDIARELYVDVNAAFIKAGRPKPARI